jgi:hypothetical protein
MSYGAATDENKPCIAGSSNGSSKLLDNLMAARPLGGNLFYDDSSDGDNALFIFLKSSLVNLFFFYFFSGVLPKNELYRDFVFVGAEEVGAIDLVLLNIGDGAFATICCEFLCILMLGFLLNFYFGGSGTLKSSSLNPNEDVFYDLSYLFPIYI